MSGWPGSRKRQEAGSGVQVVWDSVGLCAVAWPCHLEPSAEGQGHPPRPTAGPVSGQEEGKKWKGRGHPVGKACGLSAPGLFRPTRPQGIGVRSPPTEEAGAQAWLLEL